jgi:DNA-binding PadR family transcriptional regulator
MDPHGHLDGMLLAIAADGPVHGYAAAQALRERSGGVFDLPEGTIYPALHRLERAGLLQSGWSTASGRRRRVYRLTAGGKRAAASARGDWRRFSKAVEAVMA